MRNPTIPSQMFNILRGRLDLLTNYVEDFLYVDLAALGRAPEGARFAWVVREWGTHLIDMYDSSLIGYAQSLRADHPKAPWFIIEVTDPAELPLAAYPRGTVEPTSYAAVVRELRGPKGAVSA